MRHVDASQIGKRERRKAQVLSQRLERRLSSYVLAASAAGLGFLGNPEHAKANSIVYESVNETLSGPGTISLSLGSDLFRLIAYQSGTCQPFPRSCFYAP